MNLLTISREEVLQNMHDKQAVLELALKEGAIAYYPSSDFVLGKYNPDNSSCKEQ